MPEDPKDIFRRVVAKKEADRLAAAAQRKAERDRAVRMSRQPPPEDDETEASQWVRENLVWEPYPSLWCLPFCSWSDYSGFIVERSNGKALMRDFPDLFQEGHGGHGTVWVGFTDEKRRALTDDVWSSLQDIARGLVDYPLYDEDLHSAMQQESQWEYWQEYGRSATRTALVNNWSDDTDAMIAVLTLKNEDLDQMFRDFDFYDHMGEEEGDNWYFKEEYAVEDIPREAFVNDEKVTALKKAFLADTANAEELEKALATAGVFVASQDQFFDIVSYAQSASDDVWEVSNRFHDRKDEIDPFEHLSLNSEAVVNAASDPEAANKMQHLQWANDPRQMKLPGFESKAARLAAALLEVEDPKAIFRQAVDAELDEIGLCYEIRFVDRNWGSCRTQIWSNSEANALRKLRRNFDKPREIISIKRIRESEDPKAVFSNNMNDWKWNYKSSLPPEQDKALQDIEGKRQQSNATFKRLQQQLADRPELHQRLADLGTKMDRSTQLTAKLRYSMEFRHELKRMALKPEEITGLVPARSTPWGQCPLFVIGVKDQEGREHTFLRPIRVPQQ